MAKFVLVLAVLAVVLASIQGQINRQCRTVADCPKFCKRPIRCTGGVCKGCNMAGLKAEDISKFCLNVAQQPVSGAYEAKAKCAPYDYFKTKGATTIFFKCNGIVTCGFVEEGEPLPGQ